MPAPQTPLLFEPYFRPQVWGGRRLETRLGKRLPAEGAFGEAWEISAHEHHVSRVAQGPLSGARLDELWQEHNAALAGPGTSRLPKFPLLIKYLDCHELLSVQVHPSDELARRLIGNESGKTEAWVILEAEPSARIYAGLLPGTTADVLQRHLEEGTLQQCLHSFTPRAGECVFLPAGTVHAVGGGVLMAEVQQTSDATFRLFDWNRVGADGHPRKLHIAESLKSIDWSAGPVEPVKPQPLPAGSAGAQGERLVGCRYFTLERYRLRGSLDAPYTNELSIWMVLDGTAELRCTGESECWTLHRGQTVLIPAGVREYSWHSDADATLLAVRT